MKKIFFVILISIAALVGGVLCVYHYGMGVEAYYEEQLADSIAEENEVYWLEDGTIIEQLYTVRAPYMVGVDLCLIGTGAGCQGTLYVQLCDVDGNVLSQKREQLQEIEPEQYYPIRFLEIIDVRKYDKLIIRIFVRENDLSPALIAVSSDMDVQDNISCRVNGEPVKGNLTISYLYGRERYTGFRGKTVGDIEALVASLLLIVIFSFILIYFVFNMRRFQPKRIITFFKDYYNLRQILSVLWFFCIFLGASAVYRNVRRQHVPVGVYLYILCVLFITVYFVYQGRKRINCWKENIFFDSLNDKGLIAVILFSTLIRIPLFSHIQLWDGSLYYNAIRNVCSNFEYSLGYIWGNFRLCGHYAVAYTFFTAIGEFLIPDKMTGVLMMVLVLMDAALACIYKMFRGYWLNLSQKEAAIGTMLVSVCPLFLGLFSNISLDNLLVVFTVFLLYAEYKEQEVLKVVWMVVIMMTKETGFVIVGGYLFAHICVCLWNMIRQKKEHRLHYFLADFHVICTILGIVLVCLLIIKQNGLFTWMGMSNRSGGNVLSGLVAKISGFFLNFGQKAKIMFVLHFEWIPVLIIVCCLLYGLIKGKKWSSFPGQASFFGTLGAFVLANFYLYEYVLARYHIFSAVMLWILAYIMLFKIFGNCLSRLTGLGVSIAVIGILIVQNFIFIDPLTNLAFGQFDTGKGRMISTEEAGGNYSETFVTNFRYTYLYNLIDTMLKDSDFDIDMQIVIPTERDRLNFYDCVGYDKEEKRRVFSSFPDEEKVVSLNHIYLNDILSGAMDELPERGIIYFTPYIDCDEQETLKMVEQFYEIGERREVSNWGGTLAYYIIELR